MLSIDPILEGVAGTSSIGAFLLTSGTLSVSSGAGLVPFCSANCVTRLILASRLRNCGCVPFVKISILLSKMMSLF